MINSVVSFLLERILRWYLTVHVRWGVLWPQIRSLSRTALWPQSGLELGGVPHPGNNPVWERRLLTCARSILRNLLLALLRGAGLTVAQTWSVTCGHRWTDHKILGNVSFARSHVRFIHGSFEGYLVLGDFQSIWGKLVCVTWRIIDHLHHID